MGPQYRSSIIVVLHWAARARDQLGTQKCKKIREFSIDGSTDRCCIAIVTNDRALLSGSDQPERNLGRRHILYVRRENKLPKTATRTMVYAAMLISTTDTN